MAYARIKPSMLQVELHPYLQQQALLKTATQYGIPVTAFSPLGSASYVELGMAGQSDSVLAEPLITDIAQRLGRTPAQVVLRWGLQRGTAIIPKSSRSDRRADNLALDDFSLSDDDMASINTLERGHRFNNPADFCQLAFHRFHAIYE
jgi:Aldo/keto reductases, related to diketogulonate reductase